MKRLNKAFVDTMKDDDLQGYVRISSMELAAENSLPELDRFCATETKLYQGLAREIGVTAK